jgi:hypothetical protein
MFDDNRSSGVEVKMLHTEDIRRIQTEMQGPVLSLYLNVDPGYQENQASTPEWQVWLKNALRDTEAGLDREQKREWTPIRERTEAFFADYRPDSKGLVLFIGPDVEEQFTLPLGIENRAAYGEPLVTPLFWKLDEYERYLVVLVDQEQARFLTVYLGTTGEQERMEIDLDEYDFGEKSLNPATSYGKEVNQGSNREAFEATISEHRARFFRSVVERMEVLAQAHDTDRIIIGGAQEAAHALKSLVTGQAAEQIVDVLALPLRTPPHEITTRIQPIAHEYERQFEMRLLDEIFDLAHSGGRGALGRDDVLKALQEQRVELLVAAWPVEDETLMAALPAQMLQSSSTLELVHGQAADRLRDVGGLAARLYYTI